MESNLVTVSEYARLTGQNKSTVSRWVSRGVIPDHGVPGKPMINPAEADAARLASVDRSKVPGLLESGREIPLSAEGAAGVRPPMPPAAKPGRSGDYSVARAAREAAQAKMAVLNYERQAGLLLNRQDAVDAMTGIGMSVRNHLEQRVRTLTDRLFGIDDPARIAAIIREEDRRLLEMMAAAFEKLAAAGGDQVDEEEEAPDDA